MLLGRHICRVPKALAAAAAASLNLSDHLWAAPYWTGRNTLCCRNYDRLPLSDLSL